MTETTRPCDRQGESLKGGHAQYQRRSGSQTGTEMPNLGLPMSKDDDQEWHAPEDRIVTYCLN